MTDRRYKGPVKTQLEIIVAHLWQHGDWLPTHQLQNVETPYGFIGNAGHTRVRELARNDCPEKLKDKVEKARGGAIGLDSRYEYFRFKQGMSRADHLRIAREACEMFDRWPETQQAPAAVSSGGPLSVSERDTAEQKRGSSFHASS